MPSAYSQECVFLCTYFFITFYLGQRHDLKKRTRRSGSFLRSVLVIEAFAGVEDTADRLVIAKDGQLVAGPKDRVRCGRLGLRAAAVHQHDEDVVVGLEARFRKGLVLQVLGHLVKIHLCDDVAADVVHQQHGVLRALPEDALCQTEQLVVHPAAHRGHAHADHDQRHGHQREQRAEEVMLHLRQTHGEEDVDERGKERDVEHIAEQHRRPGQPAAGAAGDEHLALPGGEAAARQQGDHLEASLLIRQAGEAKEHGEKLGNDPIAQNDQRAQGKREIDIHDALLMVSLW